VWAGALILALLAFVLGHVNRRRFRQICMAFLIVSPMIVMTIGLAFVPPEPPSYLLEWPRVMSMALPVLITWWCSAFVGYFAARWSVR
jgi:hypothetical protein